MSCVVLTGKKRTQSSCHNHTFFLARHSILSAAFTWLQDHTTDHMMCSNDTTNSTKYDVYQLLSLSDCKDKSVHFPAVQKNGNKTHNIFQDLCFFLIEHEEMM
jgi:hypothetical protein